MLQDFAGVGVSQQLVDGCVFKCFEVGHLFGVVLSEGVRFGSLFELGYRFAVVSLHPFLVVLLGVAHVAFTGVGAGVFVHYHPVSADVAVITFACFVAMAVAWFIHEFQ